MLTVLTEGVDMFGTKKQLKRGQYDVTGNGVVSVKLSYLLGSQSVMDTVKAAKEAVEHSKERLEPVV